MRLPVGKLEPEFLAELLGEGPCDDPSVIVGPGVGRDVAVLAWDEGARYLIAKTDPITFATDEIGHYAVSVNANDVATSGGVPRWFLATLLLPDEGADEHLARSIFAQINAACADLGVALVGGHTEVTYDLDRPILVGMMLGEVERDRLVTSDGAQVGDRVLLTKGVAVEGTAIIARELADELSARGIDEDTVRRAANFLHQPGISVVAEARAAVAAGDVHAMHDPTEGGLATGLHELAMAAGVGLAVAFEAIPILPETQDFCDLLGLEPLGLIASGSLLIAAPPEDSDAIVDACREAGIDCADIGEVVAEEHGVKIRRGPGGRAGQATGPSWFDLPRYDQDEITKLF